MNRPTPELTTDPLQRFLDIVHALDADRRWSEGALPLRFAASTLITTQGDPETLARDVRALAEQLKEEAAWFSALKGSIRFMVAAL